MTSPDSPASLINFGAWLSQQAGDKTAIGDLAADFVLQCKLDGEQPSDYRLPSDLYRSSSFLVNACPEARLAAYEAAYAFSRFRKDLDKSKWQGRIRLNGQMMRKLKPDNVFGVWRFCPKKLTLTNTRCFYEIDLERINSTASMLDWIIQISCKGDCYGQNALKDLVAAFKTIFHPQANCCSFGKEKQFSGSKLAKQYATRLLSQIGNEHL